MAQGLGGGGQRQGGTGGRGGRGRGQEHARNSGEFSRNCAHVVLARAHCHRRPPVRPGSILRLTQQRISPTRQRILLLVTVSEYRCRRCRNFRPRRIYPREVRRRRHGGSPHAFSSARRRGGSSAPSLLAPLFSLSFFLYICLSDLSVYLSRALVGSAPFATRPLSPMEETFRCETRRINPSCGSALFRDSCLSGPI